MASCAPWRFVVIAGAARAAYAEIAVAALQARDPDAPASEAERMRGKLLAPPLIVALGVHITPNHKIPEIEQMMAVAAAAMNMLNAAHALGFGGKWITGPNAYDPAVAAALGLAAPDRLRGSCISEPRWNRCLPVQAPAGGGPQDRLARLTRPTASRTSTCPR